MAHVNEFTPGFVRNLERMEQAGQMEIVALMVALVGAARATLPLGRRTAEAALRRIACETDVDPEEIFAQVDWIAPQQLQVDQQQTPASSVYTGRSIRRALGLGEIQVTPDLQQQQQQEQQQQQQAVQGRVAFQV